MQIDDAAAFLIEYLQKPRSATGYSSFGYEFYLPNVIVAFIREIEGSTDHESFIYSGQRARDLSPVFYEAAWDLCRRGILRSGLQRMDGQATPDGASGNGYSLTTAGRQWVHDGGAVLLLLNPRRTAQLFGKLAEHLGAGFEQRANEAVTCHTFGAYLACCAMSGAAAESILLAVATVKDGSETSVLARYRTARGRQATIDHIVGQSPKAIADPFRSATQLLSYWRDDAAHGISSTISEVEAHEAIARLLRFAQFVTDNWEKLTSRSGEK